MDLWLFPPLFSRQMKTALFQQLKILPYINDDNTVKEAKS